ncbi:hypothetical protein KP509_09G084600 [Ceratopteris richardii]|uniref:DUF2306 domain-containing protein n=1 Tax=Ceratopteris richardii TaxID=49495 RepID=A0A8T2UCB7_CERRI|nr:hypothetical protein KP509_09G084600 [Ceratopteris richardii]
MNLKRFISRAGWYWAVCMWVPFALYSKPFIVGDFAAYRQLTVAALAGRLDVAGNHIADHINTWQAHALSGLLYMFIVPFQFSSFLRVNYPRLHHQIGYVFVCASLILGVTGLTTMLFNSEFGCLGRIFMGIAGVLNLVTLVLSVKAARLKQFRIHQQWMIRCVSMGYTVISARIALVIVRKMLHMSFGVPVVKAADYSVLGSILVSTIFVELYIHVYVRGEKIKTH